MKSYPIAFCLVLCFCMCGCSDKEKVRGKVAFADGTPLKAGMIFFSNDEYLGRATIGLDGTYDVGSLSTKDGIPPGKYKVYISGALEATGNEDEMRSLIDAKFCDVKSTPLEITVPGEKVFNITVEPPAAK